MSMRASSVAVVVGTVFVVACGQTSSSPTSPSSLVPSASSASDGRLTASAKGALDMPVAAAASQRETLIISTQKPLGPVPGTFSTSGAFVESGVLVTEQRIVSGVPSPFGVVTHLVLLFEGQQGTFTVRTEIIETVTDDEHIFANEGTWVIVDGTGTYSTLRGTGDVRGTVDDEANLITRVFTGLVLFTR